MNDSRTLKGAGELVVATDGACQGNPGPAGWAWVVDADRWQAGSLGDSTNNVAELEAIRRALLAVPDCPLLILTDSQYALNATTKWGLGWERNGWRTRDGRPVANRGLVKAVMKLLGQRRVSPRLEWVRGHSGHQLNEAADRLATGIVAAAPTNPMIAGPEWKALQPVVPR